VATAAALMGSTWWSEAPERGIDFGLLLMVPQWSGRSSSPGESSGIEAIGW
jgi:hypothetical protein